MGWIVYLSIKIGVGVKIKKVERIKGEVFLAKYWTLDSLRGVVSDFFFVYVGHPCFY